MDSVQLPAALGPKERCTQLPERDDVLCLWVGQAGRAVQAAGSGEVGSIQHLLCLVILLLLLLWSLTEMCLCIGKSSL